MLKISRLLIPIYPVLRAEVMQELLAAEHSNIQQCLPGFKLSASDVCLIVIQTKDQLADIKRDFASLETTSLVPDLNISLEEVIWASDMVTSRSFAFQKQLGASLLFLLLLFATAVAAAAEFCSKQQLL